MGTFRILTTLDAHSDPGARPASPTSPDRRGVADADINRRRAAIAVAITAVALAPVLATIVLHAGRTYLPVQDFALIDLRVRDVWSADLPLVGVYSRFGWNHPGPAMFWLVGLISGPFGRPAWATLVGSAALQGVAIVGAARLAWIRGRLDLVIGVLTLVGLSYVAAGADLLVDPWNPHVAFPFFVLFVLEIWSVALGDSRQLLWAALVGTFLLQAHVGYLPFVAAGAVWGIGRMILAARGGPADPRLRRRVAVSVAALGIAWTPVVIDQIRHGSTGLLLTYFLHDNGPAIGLRRGAGLLADQFRIPPPWLGGSEHLDPFGRFVTPATPWWLLIAVALITVGVVAARRTKSVADARLLELTSIFVVVAVIALARISGDLAPYLFLWRIPLALLVVLASARAVAHGYRRPARAVVFRAIAVALAIVVAVSAGVMTVRVARSEDDATAHTTRQVLAALHRRGLPSWSVLVRQAGPNPLGLEGGLFNELDREGMRVRVDPERGFEFGYGRVATSSEVRAVWYVVEDGQFLSLLSSLPGGGW